MGIVDGKLYLAYSGEKPRDSPQVMLLKRAWESLRRCEEFEQDCAHVASFSPSERICGLDQLKRKWGVTFADPGKSFTEIVGEGEKVSLDDPDQFNDMFRRLYGDSQYREDRVVQCEEYNRLFRLFGDECFERLIDAAREGAFVETSQHFSVPRQIHLVIDVDQNPIALLYKVQLLVSMMREMRVKDGHAQPLAKRITQQLHTLQGVLDADLIGDLKRDFRHDDDIFRVWDLCKEGKIDSHIAQTIWPDEYQERGGRDTVTSEKGALIQRVHNYKRRANQWIKRFAEVIKDEKVIL